MPFPCSVATTSRQAGEEAGREALGRVLRTRFRWSSHARDAPRSLRSKFGKIKNFRFRDFGSEIWAAFGLPFLAVFRVCPLVVPSDFCRIYPKISGFDSHTTGKRDRRTRGGPGGLPRWSLLTQHPLHHQKPQKSSKITKNHQKSLKIVQNHQNRKHGRVTPAKSSFGQSNVLGRDQ